MQTETACGEDGQCVAQGTAALAEGMGSIPSIHMAAHKHC